MSYAKLHSSILDSTIWLEPHHVVRVWIAMLAMKDADGIVSASIPGLAARSRVSLPECEEALMKFMAPDPYSSTPDHEGRRIEVVDGGWRVLNHDRYRDRQDRAEQRAKTAARVARFREREKQQQREAIRKASVTLGNAPSRPVTTSDTDTDPNTDDLGRAPEEITSSHARAIPPSPPAPVYQPPGQPEPIPTPARQKINHDAWTEAKLAHDLARSTGLDPGARPWSAMPSGEGGKDLAARTLELRELGDEAFVRAQYRHVIDLRLAEAKELESLEYFIPSRLFASASFSKARELSIPQAVEQIRERKRRERGPPRGEPARLRVIRSDADDPPPMRDYPPTRSR